MNALMIIKAGVVRVHRAAVIGVVLALLCASAAGAARAGHYRGTTAAGEPISFTVTHGTVTNISFVSLDKCPDGSLVAETDGTQLFSPIKIGGNSFFGGPFGPDGEPVFVSGRFHGTKVRGSIFDISLDLDSGDLCSANTRFTAARR